MKMAGTQKIRYVGEKMFSQSLMERPEASIGRNNLPPTLLLIKPLPVLPLTPKSDEGPQTLFLEAC